MIGDVGEIVEKTAPVNEVVTDINGNLDAGVDALEGLLVKKAGLEDAIGLVDGLYPGAAAAGLRDFPESPDDQAAADRRGLHQGHAHARPPRPRGADRRGQPGGRRCCATSRAAAWRRALLYPEVRQSRPGEASALAGHRHRLARPVRAARGHRRAAQAPPVRRRGG